MGIEGQMNGVSFQRDYISYVYSREYSSILVSRALRSIKCSKASLFCVFRFCSRMRNMVHGDASDVIFAMGWEKLESKHCIIVMVLVTSIQGSRIR